MTFMLLYVSEQQSQYLHTSGVFMKAGQDKTTLPPPSW